MVKTEITSSKNKNIWKLMDAVYIQVYWLYNTSQS